ncbi:hypothetical protein KC19_7G140100 [Ceratodon purpureus]|uniref:Uncharacterized protein n=2 Tax=Ceratodon purpureus TaxID=3225 RepID=A0A8T0H9J9_CERPU|nr:hypothetical protein KC19_7G140100 [Ceratodon purpureus]KAG0567505.1 hypothetical protein KC19_7G140100 [Ceratodon purpureus]
MCKLCQDREIRMMTRQSMARVSSASTEADFAPGLVPFDWEAAPGRPGRKSTKSGFFAGRSSLEAPSLPLPPGRRPNDSPDLQSEVKLESGRASSQPRKLFNLKFPGSPRKPPATGSSTGQRLLPFQSSSKTSKDRHVAEDHSFSIFNPVSGHRFGSSITRRMLEQLSKKQPLWRRCLPSTAGSGNQMNLPASLTDQNKGRRLDSVDEGYVTPGTSSLSGPSLPPSLGHGLVNGRNSSPVITKHIHPSSPAHQSSNSSPVSTKQLLQPSSPNHGHSTNSSPVVNKQVQVASSRFMASMLISLCPEDDDDADEPHFDVEDEIVDSDDRRSSPEVLYDTLAKPSECSEIVVDPASQTVLSHEECRCTCKHRGHNTARVDLSAPQVDLRKKMSRNVSRSLHEELIATARSTSENRRSGKLVQLKGDSAYTLDQNAVANQKDNADAYPVFLKASGDREPMWRREPYHSSFSWKPCTEKSLQSQESVAGSVTSDIAQDPGDSEFAKEIFEVDVGEKFERRRGTRLQLAGDLSADSNSSSSSESNWRHNTAGSRSSPSSPSIRKDIDVPVSKSKYGGTLSTVGYLSPPRTSSGDSENSNNKNKPKAFVRWKSNVESSSLRKGSPEGIRLERNQAPATRATIDFLSPPRSKQPSPQSAMPSKTKTKDRKSILKSSPQRRIPSKALRNEDTDDSDEDSECSTDSSQDNNSPGSTAISSNFASPKPSSPVLPENLLRSPSLLKFKLQRQQSHRESVHLPHMVDHEAALPGLSFKRVLMARSHSVRSSSSRVFTPQECYAISKDSFLGGSDLPPASRLAKTSSTVMSKVAEWEAKAGVGSSGKSAPLYQFNQRTTTAVPSYKSVAR